MQNYLPSDITNKDSRCTVVENFKAQLRDTVNYYVELSR